MVLRVIHGLVYGGVGYGPPGNSWVMVLHNSWSGGVGYMVIHGVMVAMVLRVIHGLVYGGVGYGPPGNSWSGVWWGWLWSSR